MVRTMTVHDRIRALLPMRDIAGLSPGDIRADLFAALGITLLAVPQGIAYAMIAGLPPAMGLYAAMVPVIIRCCSAWWSRFGLARLPLSQAFQHTMTTLNLVMPLAHSLGEAETCFAKGAASRSSDSDEQRFL